MTAERDLPDRVVWLERELAALRLAYEEQAHRLERKEREARRLAEERRRAREALADSEESFRALFDSSRDAIILLDGLVPLDCNQAALSLFGCADYGELVHRDFSVFFPPKQPDGTRSDTAFGARVGAALETGGGLFEWRHRRLDGTEFPAEVLLSRFDLKGRSMVQVTVRDTTERSRMVDALRLSKEQAEEASQAKSRFLANVSHELRTPLNAIIGYSEMLLEEAEEVAGGESMVPDLHRIESAGRHLLSLINNILDLSKIEAGKMEVHWEDVDVASVVSDVVDTVGPLIHKNGNRLEVVVPDEPGCIEADATKLRQSLINLVANAAKFTEGGVVTLSVHWVHAGGGDAVEFRVRDTGIGMTREQMEKLFRPFTQADVSTTRRFGGTGLGLALSRRFCEMMGGTIEVESRAGEGSTFTVLLPVKGARPSEGGKHGTIDVG